MDLASLRQKIDTLDSKLIALLNQRTRFSLAIGAVKRKQNQEIYVPDREERVLKRVLQANQGPLTPEALRTIYREILAGSRALQKNLVIAFLGPDGSVSHQAAVQKFGVNVKHSTQFGISDVFGEVNKGCADYGIVPIESSAEGSVTHTLDMFLSSDLQICAQIMMPVVPSLWGRNAKIKVLYTSQSLLSQCRSWLRKNCPRAKIHIVSSPSVAVELAAKTLHSAAIAHEMAAKQFGLPLLESDIHDGARNQARFLVIGRKHPQPTGHDRTTILYGVPNQAGALYRSLTPFRRHKINLTRVESRPSRRKAWEYVFFVDFEGHCEDPAVQVALTELRRISLFVKVLGSYPNGKGS